jgi:threonine/homoserine/homoserine lactone efflux protein
MDPSTLAFLGVATVVVVVPGPDMALVTRNVLRHGRRGGQWTVLGVMTGIVGWGLAAAIGVAAILAASATAFAVIKLAGAIYLIGLGIATLHHLDSPLAAVDGSGNAGSIAGRRQLWLQGLLSAGLNPKLGVFFVTLLPPFVGPGDPAILRPAELAAIFAAVGLVWLLIFTELVVRASNLLQRPRPLRIVRGISGVVLVGLGLRVATAEH